MKFDKANAIDITCLLLEFYKILGLKEKEVMVILVLTQLINDGNDFITSDLLALKMNYSLEEIDESLTILFTKKYIEYIDVNGNTITSIEPLKKILFNCFKKSLFTDEEYKENEEIERIREKIFTKFQEIFNRSLSPIEINTIDNWIINKIDEDLIINSLLDAKYRNKLSITYIDRMIINKLKEEK